MIDDMVTLLGKEQVDDGAKKEHCTSKIDKAEYEIKELEHAADGPREGGRGLHGAHDQ